MCVSFIIETHARIEALNAIVTRFIDQRHSTLCVRQESEDVVIERPESKEMISLCARVYVPDDDYAVIVDRSRACVRLSSHCKSALPAPQPAHIY